MKNKYCFDPNDGMRGTVVSDALFNSNGKQELCNVIWDNGRHCTEKIENLDISNDTNPRPPKW